MFGSKEQSAREPESFMPQHKGVEPFMFIWVIQVTVSYKPVGSPNYGCTDSRVVFFGDLQSHDDFITFVNGQTSGASRIIRIVHDYGKQKWFNDKLWILGTLSNVYINGNFNPAFKPTVGA